MRTPFEQADATVLVDKMVGNAYPVIKKLYDNLQLMEYLAFNMDAIRGTALTVIENEVVTATLPLRGANKIVALPGTLTADNVIALHGKATANGAFYLSGKNEAISMLVTPSGIQLSLSADAPAALENVTVTILVIAVG